MADNNDEFTLFPANTKGGNFPGNVSFAVYVNTRQACQVNIKVGSEIARVMSLKAKDKVEFCYSVGKRQILLRKGDRGFMLRADMSFRRTVVRGWHQEPFPMKFMSAVCFDIVTLEEDRIVLQLPKEIIHD